MRRSLICQLVVTMAFLLGHCASGDDYLPVEGPVALSAEPADVPDNDVPVETGSLRSLVTELTSEKYLLRDPIDDQRPYVEPEEALPTVRRVATMMDQGEIQQAAELAEEIDMEVVRFEDEWTEEQYLVLREEVDEPEDTRGWGAYVLNPNAEEPAIVEAPHPLGDSESVKVATMVFEEGAKGLLIAGAHREKADVPDRVDSVFHQVHVAWTGVAGQVAAWQIHGFALRKHPFPSNAKAILSTGDGAVTQPLLELDRKLEAKGIESYVFNHLPANSPTNQQVNEGAPGVKFRPLAATQNEQGRHLRSVGGEFVHVELEMSVRHDGDSRREAAEAIAKAIDQSTKDRKKPTVRVANRPGQE